MSFLVFLGFVGYPTSVLVRSKLSFDSPLTKKHSRTTNFDCPVIPDVEVTCQANSVPDPQETIDSPMVLRDLREDRIVDEFTGFVRSIEHPKLSEFCTELTSIRQEVVADAPISSEVFARHYTWLLGHDLVDGECPGVIVPAATGI